MSIVEDLPIIGPILKEIMKLIKYLSLAKKMLITFENEEMNQEVKQIILKGDINAPVYIVDHGSKILFGSTDRKKDLEWLGKRLDKGKPTELVETKFDEEFDNYKEFFDNTEYPFAFVKLLNFKYKGLIKASMYVKKLYDEGDRDIAARRKEELTITYGQEGRQFCNLYTEGYIPEVLQYIDDIGLNNNLTIQQILDYVVKYKGVLFIHGFTEELATLKKIEDYINRGFNYIAIHGAGTNISKVKKLEPKIHKLIDELGYSIKTKVTPKGKENKIIRRVIFIFNKKGESTYQEFIKGAFKGFV